MKLMNISEPGSLRICRFGTFFEVPRGAYVAIGKQVVLLLCEFDATRDAYYDHYEVYLIQGAVPRDFQTGAAYARAYPRVPLGQIPVGEIRFDPARGKSLRSVSLEAIVDSFLDLQ